MNSWQKRKKILKRIRRKNLRKKAWRVHMVKQAELDKEYRQFVGLPNT